MIVLDTNVVSEPLRPAPAPQVVAWLDDQDVVDLHLTTISLAEIRYGIAALPEGRRRSQLSEQFEQRFLPLFAGRILSFDDAASLEFATLQSAARRAGRPLPLADGLIAAIVRTRGFALATRNVRDFETAGIALVNPWDEQAP